MSRNFVLVNGFSGTYSYHRKHLQAPRWQEQQKKNRIGNCLWLYWLLKIYFVFPVVLYIPNAIFDFYVYSEGSTNAQITPNGGPGRWYAVVLMLLPFLLSLQHTGAFIFSSIAVSMRCRRLRV